MTTPRKIVAGPPPGEPKRDAGDAGSATVGAGPATVGAGPAPVNAGSPTPFYPSEPPERAAFTPSRSRAAASTGAAPGVTAALATTRRPPRASNALLMIGILVAAGGISFAVGRSTAPASAATDLAASGFQGLPNASFAPPAGAQGGPGGLGGSMTLSGTVTGVAGSTLTIGTTNGQTVTVDTSGAAYHAQAAASASDLTTGSTIQVTVSGLGSGGRPGASATPDASAQAGAGGLTATDVTIVSR